jgi:RNA polymerase sigma factor (sigma-70 family)
MFLRKTKFPSDEVIHDLVARALTHDQKACDKLFEVLLSLFQYQARSACLYFGIDKQEVDDLIQDVALHFLDDSRGRLWRVRQWFDNQKSPFIHYVASICRNRLLDLCEKHLRASSHLLDDELVYGELALSERTDTADLEVWVFADTVRERLAQLPDHYRDVIRRHYELGYTFKEIAAQLSTTPAAVEALAGRAKRRFKSLFYNLEGEGGDAKRVPVAERTIASEDVENGDCAQAEFDSRHRAI